jgi:hypothetical protein
MVGNHYSYYLVVVMSSVFEILIFYYGDLKKGYVPVFCQQQLTSQDMCIYPVQIYFPIKWLTTECVQDPLPKCPLYIEKTLMVCM